METLIAVFAVILAISIFSAVAAWVLAPRQISDEVMKRIDR